MRWRILPHTEVKVETDNSPLKSTNIYLITNTSMATAAAAAATT
jgi:hypothetical protein